MVASEYPVGMKIAFVLLFICLRYVVPLPPTVTAWYFKSKSSDSCPPGVLDANCLVLSPTLLNASALEEIFTSNVIISFLGGDHPIQLQGEGYLTYRNVENVTIVGSSSKVLNHVGIAVPASRIICQSPFSFIFSNISQLTVHNITISGCGAPVSDEILTETFVVQTKGIHTFGLGQSIAVLLINIRNFTMIRSVVQSSYGYGLLGVNVLGNSEVLGSYFLLNNNYTIGKRQCTNPPAIIPEDIFACSGGNALFVYEDLPDCPSVPIQYQLIIRSCLFGFGVNGFGGRLNDEFLTRGGTGIGVIMSQSSYGVTVELDNVSTFANAGLIGANLYIALYDVVDNSTVVIQNSRSFEANEGLLNLDAFFTDSASASAGLHIQYGLPYATPENQLTVCPRKKKFYQEDIVTIINSVFSRNVAFLGAGAYIEVRIGVGGAPDHGVAPVRFVLDRCTFLGNIGITGTGLYFSQQNGLGAGNSQLVLNEVSFINNSYIVPVKSITELFTTYQLNTIQFISSKNVTMRNCNITRSEGSALSAFGSNIVMKGNMVFHENTGLNGGGLDLQDSRVAFAPNSRITFTGNYAVNYGGAIRVVGRSDVVLPCFFQVHNPNFLRDPNVTLYFENNYARNAGSVLYGGSIDRCIVTADSGFQANKSGDVFNYLADIGPHSSESSIISSDPLNVCFCFNGKPNCSVRSVALPTFPGETIEILVVTVGQRFGTTTSFVYTIPSRPAKIRVDQETQEVRKTCTNVNFTILSTQESAARLNLQTNAFAINSKVIIDIELLACPLGFVHSNITGACKCDPINQSRTFNVSCNIDKQTIARVEGSWLNASFLGPNGTYNGILVLGNCPYDYCLQQASNVNLLEPDTQCNFNRTGVLCGACKDGLSVTLATSRCIPCSNTGIVLFACYLVAAFGLVAVVFSLDLTISCGTLSGVIFYANVLSIHQSIFFPSGEYNIITVFIAWLNLDSGIPLCLYNGFDAYARVWLGFLFPIYIWIIVLVIILVSRRSSRIARLAGQKPVSVLATFILLSYNKLLNVSIASLSFASVLEPDENYDPVWSVDGNIGFFAGRHVPLAIFAMAVILFFVIPYTLLLVIIPIPRVQAWSTNKFFSWINTLKPFLDAHQGPFKKSFRNWIGILLLARAFLTTISSFTIGEYNNDNVILVVIIFMALVLISIAWIKGGVYSKRSRNLLECSFYLNVGILGVLTLYARGPSAEASQHRIILTSGWIALLEFVGIVGYHFLRRLDSISQFRSMNKSMMNRIKKKIEQRKLSIHEELVPVMASSSIEVTTTVVSLREPLLDEVV